MKKNVLALGALLALCACATASLAPDEIARCGAQPTAEQAATAVRAYVQTSGFKDPDSVRVRNVSVVQPTKIFRGLVNGGGWDYGWEIDFEANGKNGYGAYAGYESHSIVRAPDGSVHWHDGD